MKLMATIFIILVAILHVGFLILESFLWTHPIGMKAFGMKSEMAKATKVLALNQGLYNGFLAAGLLWGVYSDNDQLKVFFLVCVMMAGIVGALTASKNIIFVQFLPAMAALLMVYFSSLS